MATNMALKRAAKANRRKAVVAEKRKSESLSSSPAAQVSRAAQLPIQHCLLCGGLSESGMATLILARGATPNDLTLGGFLIDAWCLGVKDTFFQTAGAVSFKGLLAKMEATGPVETVDPAYARKLLRDVTGWAASNGFSPHRDFAIIEKLFGNVDADACDETFQFGRDGELTYISGPSESPAQIRSRVETAGLALERQEQDEVRERHQWPGQRLAMRLWGAGGAS
jgi:hypothetical protein